MTIEIRKWLFSATLAGTLIVGIGLSGAMAQNPNELPPGSRADRREDKREAKQLRFQIEEDQRRLEADIHQFGKMSPQARDDRQRLRQDRRRLKQLQRHRRRDERIRDRQEN